MYTFQKRMLVGTTCNYRLHSHKHPDDLSGLLTDKLEIQRIGLSINELHGYLAAGACPRFLGLPNIGISSGCRIVTEGAGPSSRGLVHIVDQTQRVTLDAL